MADSYAPDDAPNVWQALDTVPFRMSAADVRKAVVRVDTDARNAAIQALVGTVMNVSACLVLLLFSETRLERIGAVVWALGWGYGMWQIVLYRKATIAATAAMSSDPSIDFYHAALVRQRDLSRGFSLWSRLVGLCVGPLLFVAGAAQVEPQHALGLYIGVAVFLTLFLWLAISLSRRRSRRYQQQIDALNHFQRDAS